MHMNRELHAYKYANVRVYEIYTCIWNIHVLNVVQEFTAWCGMQINVKKTYLLVIDNHKKSREQQPAPLLIITGETLQATNLDDAYRYVGYWGTGNGYMRATEEVVRQKIIAVRDMIKCHPLTPELATAKKK